MRLCFNPNYSGSIIVVTVSMDTITSKLPDLLHVGGLYLKQRQYGLVLTT